MNIQLLHHNWRKVPHKILFGWTNEHQQQEDLLRLYYQDGKVTSLYYKNENEYLIAIRNYKGLILNKPLVSTVEEILKLMNINNKIEEEYDADNENSTTETLSFELTSNEYNTTYDQKSKILYDNNENESYSDNEDINEENQENLKNQQIKQSFLHKVVSFFNRKRNK